MSAEKIIIQVPVMPLLEQRLRLRIIYTVSQKTSRI